jgi:hypothetical protein
MKKQIKQYVKTLEKFYNDVSSDDGLKEMFEIYWDEVRCDLYFEGVENRGTSPSGHTMPDNYIPMTFFCNSLEEFPEQYESLATEIYNLSNGKKLETIFICDRCMDGTPGDAQWED